ncbi:shikimate dehydrogenase [Rubrivirga marina]|uniref:Shikimate dehydrogenase (NADP(+)) n=1 Tax=Rubrivirga marina TaxID=1196024 RepID=A0A271IWS0_9BACT|nr:shikimate dehydrogenase [Rubrivirga marina]PAP75570.1 hypothetical protein BSZ37_03515 [Rubrivirga marina]
MSSDGRQRIGASTGLVVLLGDPVGHSLSPTLHNAAFAEQGLDLVYLACAVEADRLATAMDGLWGLGARGANVTIPHKRDALAFAAEATPTARALGAANTLIRTDSGWKADNTDVAGFLAPLVEHRRELADASVVVFGAGGAARAVVYGAAVGLGARTVTIVARRPEQAEGLADDLSDAVGETELRVSTPADATQSVRDAALVVNATPLGMGDGRAPWPNDTDFRGGQVVYDLVYRPARTPLLAAAEANGAISIGGLPMLLGQAADAYRQWTGRDVPLAVARAAALTALGQDA